MSTKVKEKLSFRINKTVYNYDGYPQNRLRDFFDLFIKVKIPDEFLVPSYKENFPASTESDEEIHAQYNKAKEAKAAKKSRTHEGDAPQQPSPSVPPPEPTPPPQQPVQAAQPAQTPIAVPPPPQQAPPPLAPSYPPPLMATPSASARTEAASARTEASYASPVVSESAAKHIQPHLLAEVNNMSAEERANINQFIEQVLAEPVDPQKKLARTSVSVVPASPRREDSVSDMTMSGGAASDKVTVFLALEGSDLNKVINVVRSVQFSEFMTLVEKKFGQKLVLSFMDGGDKIEVDDDDGLQMFFDQDAKRLKLFCNLPETKRQRNVDDSYTAVDVTAPAPAPPAAAATTQNNDQHDEIRTFQGHSAAVYCCSFSSNGQKFASASRDRSVRVWNIADGESKVMKGGHNGFVLSCDFSPSGEHIVSASDDATLKMWSATTTNRLLTLKGHSDKVYCCQFNSTGAYVVSGSCDRTVRVWNADTGAKQAILKSHSLAVFSCGFSNSDSGKHVVSASDDKLVKIWDWREGREVRNLQGHTGTVWSCKFSNDDRYVVSASMDHEIKLWDVGSGQLIRSYAGHMTPIHHALFSENSKYVLSCARDWTIMAWETETGKLVDTLTGHRNTVYHIDLLGNQLLSCSLDETIKLWKFRHW